MTYGADKPNNMKKLQADVIERCYVPEPNVNHIYVQDVESVTCLKLKNLSEVLNLSLNKWQTIA